jgi:hypothetical protein
MKIHTTNYANTFIEVAEDCNNTAAIPPSKPENRSIADLQFEMISTHPYEYTSDEVLFQVYALRNDIPKSQYKAEREKFFSKGQACMRASPLTKTYGWGIHYDGDGKMALVGKDTKEYKQLVKDKSLQVVKAMRSKKAGK